MTDYTLLGKQLAALAEGEPDFVPVLANASALLWDALEKLNWAGFYLMDRGSLLLGPFQGKPACVRIPLGKGVCGTAVRKGRSLRVPDVHAFPGHIACDSASNSELVIPIRSGGRIVGVLDLDSPELDRFTPADQTGLEGFVRVLEEVTDFTRLRA
jgi:GAF domain-containing protein